jgi:hypothetical protein
MLLSSFDPVNPVMYQIHPIIAFLSSYPDHPDLCSPVSGLPLMCLYGRGEITTDMFSGLLQPSGSRPVADVKKV